ncbi:thioredoxin-like protein, partial [Mycena maculata]
ILKLHGSQHATCTRRVWTILHELKVPFELVEVDLAKCEHKTAAHLDKQPFGQIPFIVSFDDDGFILYETRAICRYITAKHPASGLIPREAKANALFEQAAAVELTNFDPSAGKIVFEAVLKPLYGMATDAAVVEAQLETLGKKLDAYDVILGKQRYVAGDVCLTLADLFHIPYAPMLAVVGGSNIMTKNPDVARCDVLTPSGKIKFDGPCCRWYNELVARPWPAYQGGVKTTTVY